MKARRIITTLLLALVLPAALPAASAEEQGITMAFHPAPGQVYCQRESLTSTMQVHLDGTTGKTAGTPGLQLPAAMTFMVGTITRFDVRGVDAEGNTDLGVTLAALLYDMSLPGMPLTSRLDTTDPLTPPAGQNASLAALVGDGYMVRIDPLGRLVKVEGMNDMIERVMARLGLEESQREDIRQSLMQGATPSDSFPSSYIAGFYPTAPVRIGDSWQSLSSTNVNGILMLMENTYTLTARGHGAAMIEVQSVLKSQQAEVRVAALDGEPEIVMQGWQEGVLEMNEANGWITKADLEQDLKGVVTAYDPETNKVMAVEISLRTSYSLVSTPK